MSVTAPQGFVAAGIACGVKASGDLDLAVVATEDGAAVPAAAVFTQNLACAGPVRVSRQHLLVSGGRAAAVVLNSGNANCATGTDKADAERMCALTARALGCAPEEVLVCSTGLIGIPLPMAAVEAGIPNVVAARAASGGADAARAIMTTDTRPKTAVADGGGFTVGGMAKGAAMLAPNMATMLAVLTTDAEVEPAALEDVLAHAVQGSFNRVVVDGCTSTNDTVILLTSGRAGPADPTAFTRAVGAVCHDLAMQLVRDAEGHTKVVTVVVDGANSDADAERVARKLAGSLLVKCSFYGADPYWGRILSEIGSSDVGFDIVEATIAYDGVVVSKGLVPTGADAAAVLAQDEFTVTCNLGVGDGTYHVFTNDLSHAYVDENMATS